MFAIDEYFCESCKGDSDQPHMCFPKEKIKKFTCEFCGQEDVTHKHICKEKVGELKYMCLNCGMLAVHESQLCDPIDIEEEDKEKWQKIVKEQSDKKECANCNQPVKTPGHKCDPKLPFTCEFCSTTIENHNHVCKQMMGKMKFYCNLCGRLAPSKYQLCNPKEL